LIDEHLRRFATVKIVSTLFGYALKGFGEFGLVK
jgi:hypothetical protein